MKQNRDEPAHENPGSRFDEGLTPIQLAEAPDLQPNRPAEAS
jgi:hypothetical protein